MKNRIYLFVLVLCTSYAAFSQIEVNSYKYILIPRSFDFLKSEDQYQLNSLTKFLFNKHGYNAFFEGGEFPADLVRDRCLALTADVDQKKSGLFKTKVEIRLKDCYGNTIATSKIGESRLKKYDRAYAEALRDAFKTFQNFEYKYDEEAQGTTNSQIETDESQDAEEDEMRKADTLEKPKVQETLKKPKTIALKQVANSSKDSNKEIPKSTLQERYFVQSTESGYRVVDASSKLVLELLSTAAEHVFLVKDKNAIVFKKNDVWIYSENNGTSRSEKIMKIKF